MEPAFIEEIVRRYKACVSLGYVVNVESGKIVNKHGKEIGSYNKRTKQIHFIYMDPQLNKYVNTMVHYLVWLHAGNSLLPGHVLCQVDGDTLNNAIYNLTLKPVEKKFKPASNRIFSVNEVLKMRARLAEDGKFPIRAVAKAKQVSEITVFDMLRGKTYSDLLGAVSDIHGLKERYCRPGLHPRPCGRVPDSTRNEIRRLHRKGFSQHQLAKDFKISRGTVATIVNE